MIAKHPDFPLQEDVAAFTANAKNSETPDLRRWHRFAGSLHLINSLADRIDTFHWICRRPLGIPLPSDSCGSHLMDHRVRYYRLD